MKGPDDSAQKDAQKAAQKAQDAQQAQANSAKALQQKQDDAQRQRGAGVGAFLAQGDQGKGILNNLLGV